MGFDLLSQPSNVGLNLLKADNLIFLTLTSLVNITSILDFGSLLPSGMYQSPFPLCHPSSSSSYLSPYYVLCICHISFEHCSLALSLKNSQSDDPYSLLPLLILDHKLWKLTPMLLLHSFFQNFLLKTTFPIIQD